MNNKVIYFSRSGNSKRVAEKIAGKLDCGTVELTDNISWKGIFGFFKGGFYSLTQKITEISLENDYSASNADNIILVVPLWAGGTAPAGYSFLLKEIKNISNLTIVICSDGTDAGKAYGKLEALVGEIKNKYGIVKSQKNEDEVINEICNSFIGK